MAWRISIIDEMRRPASSTEHREISNQMRAHHEVGPKALQAWRRDYNEVDRIPRWGTCLLRRLRRGSRDYSPIRVHEPEKKSTRLDQPRDQAQSGCNRSTAARSAQSPISSFTLAMKESGSIGLSTNISGLMSALSRISPIAFLSASRRLS